MGVRFKHQAFSNAAVAPLHAAEVLKNDADGNLTNDGRWSFTWDAENRLTVLTNFIVANQPKVKVKFGKGSPIRAGVNM